MLISEGEGGEEAVPAQEFPSLAGEVSRYLQSSRVCRSKCYTLIQAGSWRKKIFADSLPSLKGAYVAALIDQTSLCLFV